MPVQLSGRSPRLAAWQHLQFFSKQPPSSSRIKVRCTRLLKNNNNYYYSKNISALPGCWSSQSLPAILPHLSFQWRLALVLVETRFSHRKEYLINEFIFVSVEWIGKQIDEQDLYKLNSLLAKTVQFIWVRIRVRVPMMCTMWDEPICSAT